MLADPRTGPTFAALATMALLLTPSARADDFYKGKTIVISVGNSAASGFDAYARLLARGMSKHIPGAPNVIVQHMPGAGGAKVNEHTALIAPKDGTAIAITMPGSLLQPLIEGADKYRYDPTELSFIGNADSGTRVCIIAARSGVKSLDDARSKKVTLGSTAPGGSLFDYAKFKKELLGMQFNIITGYPSPGDVLVAVERGELDGVCGLDISTLKTLRPEWIGSKDYNILVQVNVSPDRTNAEMTKLGVPSLWKYVPGDKRQVVELIVGQQAFHRPFLAPPGTAPAQLKILRDAFTAALKDPEILAEADKMKLAVDPTTGEEVTAAVKAMYASPRSLVNAMSEATKP